MKKLEKWLNSYQNVNILNNLSLKLVLFLFIVVLMPIRSFESMGEVPTYLYTPNSSNIAYYIFNTIPSTFYFKVIDLIHIPLIFILFFGKRNFIAGIILCISLTICFALRNSFGKIDHNYLNIIIFPILGYIFDDSIRKDKNWIYGTFLFLFAFTFISAGIPKLLDPRYFSDFKMVRQEIINHGNLALVKSWDRLFGGEKSFVWELFDYAGVFFETFLPFMIFWKKKYIPLFIFFAMIFHIFNNAVFGIYFEGMMYGYIFLLSSFLFKKESKVSVFLDTNKRIIEFLLLALCLFFIFNKSYFYHVNLLYKSKPLIFICTLVLSLSLFGVLTYKSFRLKKEKNSIK